MDLSNIIRFNATAITEEVAKMATETVPEAVQFVLDSLPCRPSLIFTALSNSKYALKEFKMPDCHGRNLAITTLFDTAVRGYIIPVAVGMGAEMAGVQLNFCQKIGMDFLVEKLYQKMASATLSYFR